MSFYIECVTICVDYSDFLNVTIPKNIGIFDRWIIITTPEDLDTREICRKYNLECHLTKSFYEGGHEFNKAKGINLGLERLSKTGWVCHMDSDIVLPIDTRRYLEISNLDEDTVYGIDRVMIKNYEDWVKLSNSTYLQHDYHSRCNFPNNCNIGARWVSPNYGYCPIGFFQLWWGQSTLYRGITSKRYPDVHNDAARADVQFSLQFDRNKRGLIPEIVGIHLESEAAPLGANWKGRKTKKFGPSSPSSISSSSPAKKVNDIPLATPVQDPKIVGGRNRRGHNDPEDPNLHLPPS